MPEVTPFLSDVTSFFLWRHNAWRRCCFVQLVVRSKLGFAKFVRGEGLFTLRWRHVHTERISYFTELIWVSVWHITSELRDHFSQFQIHWNNNADIYFFWNFLLHPVFFQSTTNSNEKIGKMNIHSVNLLFLCERNFILRQNCWFQFCTEDRASRLLIVVFHFEFPNWFCTY